MLRSLPEAYETIATAMVDAAKQRSAAIAAAVAAQCGLIELGDGTPSQHMIWERQEGGATLRFEWRWYDQSRAFSIQPDMNILALALRQDDKVLCNLEHRYED